MYRIAVDARPLSLPVTGIGRYTQAILTRLIADGGEWFLYSDRPLLWPERLPKNVHVRYPKLMMPKAGSLFAQLVFPIWCQKDKIQLFWSSRHHLPLLLSSRVRSLVTIHDLVWKRFPETMSRFGRALDATLMPPSIRKASEVISVSGSISSEIQSIWPSVKVNTIYEAPFLSPSKNFSSGSYFLFVGTIEPRKNLSRLLKAYSQYVHSCDEPLPLKICGGRGWGMPALRRMISSLGINLYTELLGYVPDIELPRLYREARALLMPSLYEGFGLPIVEAFSQNTPVVTSDRGAMKEVAGSAAILVNPDSTEEIVRALECLTKELDVVHDLQKKARLRAQNFSWDLAAEQTLKIMKSLL